MREAVASIVASRVPLAGARVLELFAGTGAYSFELLSRGAAHAVLVERDARAMRDIEASRDALALAPRTTLVRAEIRAGPSALALPAGTYDVVIADPPYDAVGLALSALAGLAEGSRLEDGALAILEHRTSDAAKVDAALATSSRLSALSRYRYGDTTISLLEARARVPDGEPGLDPVSERSPR